MSSELEFKFRVPAACLGSLEKAMERAGGRAERLLAVCFDTTDEKLARHGVTLRLRQEGRQWIQTAKVVTADPLERLEDNAAGAARHQVALGLHVQADRLEHVGLEALGEERNGAQLVDIVDAVGAGRQRQRLADVVQEAGRDHGVAGVVPFRELRGLQGVVEHRERRTAQVLADAPAVPEVEALDPSQHAHGFLQEVTRCPRRP